MRVDDDEDTVLLMTSDGEVFRVSKAAIAAVLSSPEGKARLAKIEEDIRFLGLQNLYAPEGSGEP